jgi:hypothetical protein
LGIDPGFGSSPFGIVITEWVDNQIQIAYAEEFPKNSVVPWDFLFDAFRLSMMFWYLKRML